MTELSLSYFHYDIIHLYKDKHSKPAPVFCPRCSIANVKMFSYNSLDIYTLKASCYWEQEASLLTFAVEFLFSNMNVLPYYLSVGSFSSYASFTYMFFRTLFYPWFYFRVAACQFVLVDPTLRHTLPVAWMLSILLLLRSQLCLLGSPFWVRFLHTRLVF